MSFYVATVVVVIFVLFFWRVRSVKSEKRIVRPSTGILLLSFGIITCIILIKEIDRWQISGRGEEQKIALSIVFDTSLSMYAGPDPTSLPQVKTRLERSKEIVLDILNILDEGPNDILVSFIVFTVRAANILSWNPNLREVGATVDKILTANLIGRGGTDLGGALARAVEVFDTLNERDQADTKKILLFVSDGERTVNMVDIEESLRTLQQMNVTVIALQVGLLNEPEGIREYDESGFTGFWRGTGETYTVPDVNTMVAIGGQDNRNSLYVRAEDPQASGKIIGFLGDTGGIVRNSLTGEQILLLGLWLLSVLLLKRLVD